MLSKKEKTSMEKIIQITHNDMVAICKEELHVMYNKSSKEIETMSSDSQEQFKTKQLESEERL